MIHIRPRRLRTTPAMRRLVREVEVTDGTGNEEKEPDVLLQWQ